MQMKYANHLEVLQSKVVVLNVQEKDIEVLVSGKCKEAELPRTAEEVSKRLLVMQKPKSPQLRRQTVTDILHTGYRQTGIKAAGALHRLLFGT